MNSFLCADLYDAAFLLSCGANFMRVKEYYRNSKGKSFSILELSGVTLDMLAKLSNANAPVNFHLLKKKRTYIKKKIQKYSYENTYKPISSKQVYNIHHKLKGIQKTLLRNYKTGPKRIMENEEKK